MAYFQLSHQTVIQAIEQQTFELEKLINNTPMIFAPVGTKKRFREVLEQLRVHGKMIEELQKPVKITKPYMTDNEIIQEKQRIENKILEIIRGSALWQNKIVIDAVILNQHHVIKEAPRLMGVEVRIKKEYEY